MTAVTSREASESQSPLQERPSAAVFSVEGISADTEQSLARQVPFYVRKGIRDLYVFISGTGGPIGIAVNCSNILQSAPLRVITHAIGCVRSSAVTLFLAGAVRRACPASSFMFHRTRIAFEPGATRSAAELEDIIVQLRESDELYSRILLERTRWTPDEIKRLMGAGVVTVSPEEALAEGLVHEICPAKIPSDAVSIRCISAPHMTMTKPAEA